MISSFSLCNFERLLCSIEFLLRNEKKQYSLPFPSSGAESFFVRALAAVSSDGTDRGRGTELDDVILCNNPLSINLNATGQ